MPSIIRATSPAREPRPRRRRPAGQGERVPPIYAHGVPIDPASRGLDPKRYRVTLSVDLANEGPLTKADLAKIEAAFAPEFAASPAVYAQERETEAPKGKAKPSPRAKVRTAPKGRTKSAAKVARAPVAKTPARARRAG